MASLMICVDATGLTAARPDKPLFTDISVTVSSGDRLGVVGINGSGKSTLLRLLAGATTPDVGTVRFGRSARVGFLDQDPTLPDASVRDAVGGGWQGEAVLDRLGMAALLDASTKELSGGQAKRVALGRLLVAEHDLLILDEPTNHLDLDAISFLEDRLARFTGGLILVTHDRHVLDRLTTRVLEIDRGGAFLHVPQGQHAGSGYAAYLAARAEREERAAVAEDVRKNLARRELAWLRRGAPARTRKPKARIDTATALVEGGPQQAARAGDLSLDLGATRLGSKVLELHHVGFSWPSGAMVLDGVEHIVEPGDRLGLVGANGSGKSTLLDVIAGRRQPTAGRIERGATVKIGYYDQRGVELDLTARVRDAVVGPHRTPGWEDARLMERFWFDTDAQWARIGTLSGGERRRLQLLLVLAEQPNVLLLDEPTNDLDLDTLRVLEDFLDDWPGALVVVSHDRTFLDRTVEEVMALDGRGHAALVRGGYAGWMATRTSSMTQTAAAPAAVVRPERARGATGPSASTLRRMLATAERALNDSVKRRDSTAQRLNDASSGGDHVVLAELGHALAEAEAAVSAAEERWLDLAAQADGLGIDV